MNQLSDAALAAMEAHRKDVLDQHHASKRHGRTHTVGFMPKYRTEPPRVAAPIAAPAEVATKYPWITDAGNVTDGYTATFGSFAASFTTATPPEDLVGLAINAVGASSEMKLVVGDITSTNDILKFSTSTMEVSLTWTDGINLTLVQPGSGGKVEATVSTGGDAQVKVSDSTDYVAQKHNTIERYTAANGLEYAVFTGGGARGDIIVFDGDKWSTLGIGSEGDVLRAGGDGMPYWDTPEACS